MPIYEYRCEKGHNFEVTQRMADDTLTACTTCSAPVQRVFHPVAVHFKGSGFYNTDYGKQKSGSDQGPKADSDTSSSKESKSSSKESSSSPSSKTESGSSSSDSKSSTGSD